jgi:hypothetical protein
MFVDCLQEQLRSAGFWVWSNIGLTFGFCEAGRKKRREQHVSRINAFAKNLRNEQTE